jgi:hypothetical protein
VSLTGWDDRYKARGCGLECAYDLSCESPALREEYARTMAVVAENLAALRRT